MKLRCMWLFLFSMKFLQSLPVKLSPLSGEQGRKIETEMSIPLKISDVITSGPVLQVAVDVDFSEADFLCDHVYDQSLDDFLSGVPLLPEEIVEESEVMLNDVVACAVHDRQRCEEYIRAFDRQTLAVLMEIYWKNGYGFDYGL